MNYLVAHYKHVEKETAYLERWCERNKVGDLTEEQVNLIWESIGREPPRLPPLDTPGPSSNGPGPEAANRNAASGPSVQLGTPTIPPAAAQLDPAATAAAHNPGNRDANNNNDTNANGSSGSRLKERQKPKATNWKKGRSMQNRKSEEAHSSSGQSRSSAPRTMSSVSRSGTDSKGSRAGSALVNLPSTPQTTLIPCDAVSERCLMASPRDDRPPDIVGIAPSDTDGILYVADAQNAQVKLFDLKNRGVSVVCCALVPLRTLQ